MKRGISVIFRTITNKWTEELARAVTMAAAVPYPYPCTP